MGSNIAEAAIEAGLPPQSVNQFVGDLLAQNTSALFQINGTTPQIIGAGAGALLDTYALGFRNVWLAALAFIVLAAIGKIIASPIWVSLLTPSKPPCFCLIPARSSITTSTLRLRKTRSCTVLLRRTFVVNPFPTLKVPR